MKNYKEIKTQTKNKPSEVFYRNAENSLLNSFIDKTIKEIHTFYVSSLNNKTKINKLLEIFKNAKDKNFNILINNSIKIILKWFKKTFRNQSNFSDEQLKKVFKSITLNNLKDKKILNLLKLVVEENVGLIKNTSQQTLHNIESIVYNAVTDGQGWEDIEKNLYHQKEISENRIKRIARDQTAKTTEAINRLQQQSAGIEYFIWVTAHDERVSTGYGGHKQLDGNIYKYNEENKERLPIIDSQGNRGYPNERVNCRCSAYALIVKEGYQVVWNNNKKKYEVVKL